MKNFEDKKVVLHPGKNRFDYTFRRQYTHRMFTSNPPQPVNDDFIALAMTRLREIHASRLAPSFPDREYAEECLAEIERRYRWVQTSTGHPDYSIWAMDFPDEVVRARDDRGPSFVGPTGMGERDSSYTLQLLSNMLYTVNRRYYDSQVAGKADLTFMKRAFYGGTGTYSDNNSPREDHPLFKALADEDLNACWDILQRYGVRRELTGLCLAPPSNLILQKLSTLMTIQHTYGTSRAHPPVRYNNAFQLKERGIWGDTEGVTYLATYDIKYYDTPQKDNRGVRIVLDNQELFRTRNIFIDPGSFSRAQEMGECFFIFGGIPIKAIKSIENCDPEQWLQSVE